MSELLRVGEVGAPLGGGLGSVVTTVAGAEYIAALLDGLDPIERERVEELIAHPPVAEGGRRPRI